MIIPIVWLKYNDITFSALTWETYDETTSDTLLSDI